jgi:FkbM family methyltransferase
MSVKVLYGAGLEYIDVTDIAMNRCWNSGNLMIPGADIVRASIFGDPLFGTLKDIKIVTGDRVTTYNDGENIDIFVGGEKSSDRDPSMRVKTNNVYFASNEAKLDYIHRNIIFIGGNVRDEYQEQYLTCKFLPADAKVLEIGANIGRNTMTIASIITDETKFVTLECDPVSASTLMKNRNSNGFKFHIEEAALSDRKLFQKGWNTFTEDIKPDDAVEIKTIKWSQLREKYNIEFDTIIADCEGALYIILNDHPEILDNIKLLIVENDYTDYNHKLSVDSILKDKGLQLKTQLHGGWGPCQQCFYEVWSKD